MLPSHPKGSLDYNISVLGKLIVCWALGHGAEDEEPVMETAASQVNPAMGQQAQLEYGQNGNFSKPIYPSTQKLIYAPIHACFLHNLS